MKRIEKLLVLVIAVLSMLSCVTSKEAEPDRKYATHTPIQFENEDLTAMLMFKNPQWVQLSIQNNTASVITLIIDLSSFTEPGGTNSKLVPEGTKFIDANDTVPPITIPPDGMFIKSFFAVESISYKSGKYGGWRTAPWVPDDLTGSSFVFGYKISGEEKFIIFQGKESKSTAPKQDEILGKVTVSKTFWNILFLNSIENRKKELYDEALADAIEKYGANVELRNLEYEGKWNGLSLLLYFSMLGFVENATLSADVVASE